MGVSAGPELGDMRSAAASPSCPVSTRRGRQGPLPLWPRGPGTPLSLDKGTTLAESLRQMPTGLPGGRLVNSASPFRTERLFSYNDSSRCWLEVRGARGAWDVCGGVPRTA